MFDGGEELTELLAVKLAEADVFAVLRGVASPRACPLAGADGVDVVPVDPVLIHGSLNVPHELTTLIGDIGMLLGDGGFSENVLVVVEHGEIILLLAVFEAFLPNSTDGDLYRLAPVSRADIIARIAAPYFPRLNGMDG